MWIAEGENGKFAFQNVYTGRYIEPNGSMVRVYNTVTDNGYRFDILNSTCEGYYDIRSYVSGEWFMSCSYDGKILSWFAGEGSEPTVSEWTFEKVAITQEEIDEARRRYTSDTQFSEDVVLYYTRFSDLFNDDSCTDLKSTYKSMTDEQMLNTMEGFPQIYIDIALKIKNGTWGEYEKEFRTATYKPYSDADNWGSFLKANPYSKLNAPTGITAKKGDILLVFVDKEINSPSSLYLEEIEGNNVFSSASVELKKGLNLITATKGGSLFVTYKVDTYRTTDTPVLADYPDVNIHIEGGTLNGYFDKSRHTNEDWVKMQNLILKHDIVNVKGEHAMFHMHRDKVTAICPDNIYESIDWWDTIVMWEKELMGATQYADRWNNMMLCADGEGQYMFATYYYTYYEYSTLKDILPKDRVFANPGFAWGPAHEIGHMNQGAINIVSCTEVSNNLFSNMVVQRMGKTTTRGQKMDVCYNDWKNHIPFPLRGEVFSKTRMYWQLYLYFHEAGHDKTFYPRLFEYLRETPLSGTSGVNAKFNQLRFAEACCEIAQMDLSEFFEAWGFFIPMKNAFVGDYGHHWVYLLEEDAKASKARMQKYEKKGGHLMFLEDRIRKSPQKKSPFSDGKGYRANYADWDGERIADPKIGIYGQWMDYIDESVKAQGYYYAVSQGVVLIKEAENAGGALGFKLYNAETGELLTYTNKKSMKVPSSAQGAMLKVVAAQADGTDYVVPHASQGPAEMQKEALKGSIGKAQVILNKIAADEVSVGRYYPEAVANLQELTNKAIEAYSATVNNSEYSYAEWSMIIDEECNKVLNNEDARVLIKEGATFKMKSYRANYRSYYLVGNYPNADKTQNDEKDPVEWEIEYAGAPGEYYLKSASTGYYITEIGVGGIGLATKEQVDAIKFTVAYTDAATVKFISVDDENMAVGLYDGGKVAGIPVDDSGAEWTVEIVKNNTAEFYTQALEELMAEANIKITEVLNLDSLNTMNIFNDNIIVLDNNLNTYALDLLQTYYEVSEKAEAASVAQKQKYVDTLRKQLLGVEGRYLLIAPIVTAGERVVWHYIISNKTEKIVGISTSGRNKGVLTSVTDYETDDVLWSFVSTGKANEYKLYNAGQKGFVYKKGTSELRVSATEDYLPVTVKYDAEVGGLVLSAAGRYFNESTSSVSLGITNNTVYRIQTALIETNKEVADVITVIESVLPEANGNDAIYDLGGRRVEKPTRGIFIQNGKKVLVK